MDTAIFNTLINAASGLVGALVGGGITALISAFTLSANFQQQRALEEQRHQQRLDFEVAERNVRAAALRRSVLRLLRRLHNTANLSPTSRINLDSWVRAAEALRSALENPETDLLLTNVEYDAVWKAAGEGDFAARLMRQGSVAAVAGATLNQGAARHSLQFFFESLRDALEAFDDDEHAARATATLARGFVACGMFLSDDEVFYPMPADGGAHIVKLTPLF